MLKGCGMGILNFVYIFYLDRYLFCSQCKGGVFVSNVNLSVIVTCCVANAKGKPKEGGEAQNRSKSRHFPPPLRQSVFLSGLSFPSTTSLPPIADFYSFLVWAVGDASPYNSFFER